MSVCVFVNQYLCPGLSDCLYALQSMYSSTIAQSKARRKDLWCFLSVSWIDDEASPLPLCYQCWPWRGRRPTCGQRGLLNICVYPRAKTNRLYLPQSNIPSTERSQERRDVAWDVPLLCLGLFCLIFQTEPDWNLYKRTSLLAKCNHILNILQSTVICWFALFPEKKAQISKQHLEGIWPLTEWKGKKEEAGLINQLPTLKMLYSHTVGHKTGPHFRKHGVLHLL